VESCMIASETSIEAALEPSKLDEGIGNRIRDLGGRLAVQSLGLDQPSADRRPLQGAPKVPRGLRVVVYALATGGVVGRNCEPPESDAVHDHIRLGQH
jgi:hypothetical protein